MKKHLARILAVTGMAAVLLGCGPEDPGNHGTLQLIRVKAGETVLAVGSTVTGIALDADIVIEFSSPLDIASGCDHISLEDQENGPVPCSCRFSNGNRTITLEPLQELDFLSDFSLVIGSGLKGYQGETFPGITYQFATANGTLLVDSIFLNGEPFGTGRNLRDVDRQTARFEILFSDALDPDTYQDFFNLSGQIPLTGSLSNDRRRVTLDNRQVLEGYKRYDLSISSNLTSSRGFTFTGFSNGFYTRLDSTYKFPEVSDEELIDLVQRQTFRYFWDFGHPACGLARERNTSGDIVTIGGSGFGVMALIVGMERNFITRSEGLERITAILGFLETCDRYHGAWPHWLNGLTGKTVPFSPQDDGGDLVETSFMIQGLLTLRSYLDSASVEERLLIDRINALWETVEWTWFQNGMDVLFWHWSPNYNFNMNHQIRGYNETLITYILAAASPTFSIPASAYHNGYASGGSIRNGRSYFGIRLPLGWDFGGPLFFTHYSFLGLDPRNLKDSYADYWEQNVNQSLINWNYCVANPLRYVGYSADSWGLTASDNQSGYSAHSPTNDLGVISPTAAVSALPYVPEQSLRAIRHFYYLLGDKLWGEYGFYDAFDVTRGWWADSYIAIDQGPIVVMLENYRTGLLWDLFMTGQEVKVGLDRLGFTY